MSFWVAQACRLAHLICMGFAHLNPELAIVPTASRTDFIRLERSNNRNGGCQSIEDVFLFRGALAFFTISSEATSVKSYLLHSEETTLEAQSGCGACLGHHDSVLVA